MSFKIIFFFFLFLSPFSDYLQMSFRIKIKFSLIENWFWFCFFAYALLYFIHSHFIVLTLASEILFITFLFVVPRKPISDSALQRDFAVNSFVCTSVGRQETFQPFLWHCISSSLYFDFFLSCASSIWSSHGTVNFYITIFFNLFEKNKSRRKAVFIIWFGNTNLNLKSTLNSQYVTGDRMFGFGFFVLLGFVPAAKFPGLDLFPASGCTYYNRDNF